MNTSLIQPPLLIYCLGWTLLNFLWQGILIAALLRAALAFVPSPQANLRYLLCYGALLACLCGCIATWVLLARNCSYSTGIAVADIHSHSFAGSLIWNEKPGSAAYQWTCFLDPWIGFITLGWTIGVLVGTLRFCLGLVEVRSLAAGGRRLDDPSWLDHIQKLSRQLGMDQPVGVVCSMGTSVPVVIGFFKPLILIPASLLSQLSSEQIECILAHELAHIRRGDYFANICQVIIESILFYHPAIWWIGTEIRREREYCCDDLVLSTHADGVLYAKALATLEQSRSVSLENTLSMAASGSSLVQRIRRILNSSMRDRQNTQAFQSHSTSIAPGAFLLILIFSLLLVVVLSGPISAQAPLPAKPANETVWITSDGNNIKNEGDVTTWGDNVACHFQNYTLTADHLTFNRKTRTVQGTGNAKLITPNGSKVLGYQITIPDCESKPLKPFYVTRGESPQAEPAPDGRVATVDLNKVFNLSPQTKAAQEELNKAQAEYAAEVSTNPLLKQDKTKELQELLAKRHQEILDEINKALLAVQRADGYKMVLDTSDAKSKGIPSVFAVDGVPDISAEVIAQMQHH